MHSMFAIRQREKISASYLTFNNHSERQDWYFQAKDKYLEKLQWSKTVRAWLGLMYEWFTGRIFHLILWAVPMPQFFIIIIILDVPRAFAFYACSWSGSLASSHFLTEIPNTLLTKLGKLSLSVQMLHRYGKVKFEVTCSMHNVIEWIRCVLEKALT